VTKSLFASFSSEKEESLLVLNEKAADNFHQVHAHGGRRIPGADLRPRSVTKSLFASFSSEKKSLCLF
jgi:hypothetical protein